MKGWLKKVLILKLFLMIVWGFVKFNVFMMISYRKHKKVLHCIHILIILLVVYLKFLLCFNLVGILYIRMIKFENGLRLNLIKI